MIEKAQSKLAQRAAVRKESKYTFMCITRNNNLMSFVKSAKKEMPREMRQEHP